MEKHVAGLAFVVAIFIFIILGLIMTYLSMKAVQKFSTYKMKSKVSKLDLTNYIILDFYKGVPRTLQEKNNPNKIIYL